VKELPALFRGEMVRAILEDRKTQTRRVIKHPEYFGCFTGDCPHLMQSQCDEAIAALVHDGTPYGRKGDRLWVKETFARVHEGLLQNLDPDPDSPLWKIVYRADGEPAHWKEYGLPWKPSIFMPRRASRITLEVQSVRIERLRNITTMNAIEEGCDVDKKRCLSSVDVFAELWDSINFKAHPWISNPWVYVISFKRITP